MSYFQNLRNVIADQGLLLDKYPGAAVAFSHRLLRSGYIEPLISSRRSSDDAEKDFYPDENKELSLDSEDGAGTSLGAWISTDDEFRVSWHDQSLNGFHAVQPTSGSQPKGISGGILETENEKPTLNFGFGGLDHRLDSLFQETISAGGHLYIFIVCRILGGDNSARVFDVRGLAPIGSGNGYSFVRFGGTNEINTIVDSNGSGNNIATNSLIDPLKLVTFSFNGTTGEYRYSEPDQKSGIVGNMIDNEIVPGEPLSIGGVPAGGRSLEGKISEIIIYTSDQSGNEAAINRNIKDYYSITDPEFTMLVKTDNSGTSSVNQFTIPTTGLGYDYKIETSEQSLTGQTGDVTLEWAEAGVYEVKITGDFPRIYFNNSGDRSKLIEIQNWGDIEWASMDSAFYGCNNMIITADDAPDLSLVTTCRRMLLNCGSFNQDINHWDVSNVGNMFEMLKDTNFNKSLNNWDVSNVTVMRSLFHNTPFNQDIGDWNVSSAVNMLNMFLFADSFDQDLGSWNFASANSMTNFLNGTALSTANYNSLLIALEATNQNNGYSFHGGNAVYTSGGAAEAARTALINDHSVTITDDGSIDDVGDLFVLEMGQSNMEGFDGDDPLHTIPVGEGYFWDNTIENIVHLTNDRGGADGGSHATYFAERLRELSGLAPMMIEGAVDSAGLTEESRANNNYSADGDNRQMVENIVNQLVHRHPSFSGLDYALWCQGEADADKMNADPSYTPAIVKAAMQDVIDWFQSTYPGVPFIISQTGRKADADTQGFQDMRQIQQEIVDENAGVYMAFTGAVNFPSEGKMSDNVHYNYEGYRDMGRAFAEQINSLL